MEYIFLACLAVAVIVEYKIGNLVLFKKQSGNAPATKPAPVVKPQVKPATKPVPAANIDYDIPTWKRRGVVIEFGKRKGKKRTQKRVNVAPVQQQPVEQPCELQEPQFEVIA